MTKIDELIAAGNITPDNQTDTRKTAEEMLNDDDVDFLALLDQIRSEMPPEECARTTDNQAALEAFELALAGEIDLADLTEEQCLTILRALQIADAVMQEPSKGMLDTVSIDHPCDVEARQEAISDFKAMRDQMIKEIEDVRK